MFFANMWRGRSNGENDIRVVKKLIWSLLPAQASAATFALINSLGNNVIVGRYFGKEALAAIGFVGPLTMLGSVISSVFSTGASVICGKAIGKGKKDEIQRIFNTTFFSSAFFSVLISLVFLALSRPLAILLGVAGEDIDKTAEYILGIGTGVGFVALPDNLSSAGKNGQNVWLHVRDHAVL